MILILLRYVLPPAGAVAVVTVTFALFPHQSASVSSVGYVCAFVIGVAFGKLGARAADWYLRRPPKQPRR